MATWGYVRPEKQTVEDPPLGGDCSNTVAKPLDNARRTWTTLEYRPSAQTATDGPGQCAHSYGLEGRARHVPDEVVDRGLSRPLADNTEGVATWLDAREPCRGGDLIRKRSAVINGMTGPVPSCQRTAPTACVRCPVPGK